MQADQERLLRLGVAVDNRDGAITQQVGQIAVLLDLDVAIPTIVSVGRRRAELVVVVIERTATKSIEVIVTALQGAEVGQTSEVPLADQRRPVAGFPKQRRHGRVLWRQADLTRLGTYDRLFKPDRK